MSLSVNSYRMTIFQRGRAKKLQELLSVRTFCLLHFPLEFKEIFSFHLCMYMYIVCAWASRSKSQKSAGGLQVK